MAFFDIPSSGSRSRSSNTNRRQSIAGPPTSSYTDRELLESLSNLTTSNARFALPAQGNLSRSRPPILPSTEPQMSTRDLQTRGRTRVPSEYFPSTSPGSIPRPTYRPDATPIPISRPPRPDYDVGSYGSYGSQLGSSSGSLGREPSYGTSSSRSSFERGRSESPLFFGAMDDIKSRSSTMDTLPDPEEKPASPYLPSLPRNSQLYPRQPLSPSRASASTTRPTLSSSSRPSALLPQSRYTTSPQDIFDATQQRRSPNAQQIFEYSQKSPSPYPPTANPERRTSVFEIPQSSSSGRRNRRASFSIGGYGSDYGSSAGSNR